MYQGKYQTSNKPSAPKKRRRLAGTIVFYSVLLTIVVLFFVGMGFVMDALNDWLVRFEASQPHTKCEEVFAQLFSDPDWENIYALSGTEDHDDINPRTYAAYMESKVAGRELNYIQTSAGLSGDKKYIVRADAEKVATFTLTQADPEADIPNWQLGAVEIFYTAELDYRIVTVPGCTVLVNGEALEESHTIRVVTTKAEHYLPEGVHGYQLAEMTVGGFLVEPTVEILDPQGQPVALNYDAQTQTYSHEITSAPIGDSEYETLLTAAQTYCKYMIGASGKADLKKCFDADSRIYTTITTNTTWMQSYAGYDFGEAAITGYYRYTDSLYSARVSLTLNVTRGDGTVKEYELSNTFFLERGSDGSWLVTEMINADAQEPVTQVRLTYMEGDTLLSTELVDAQASTLTPPGITAPQGKVFSGWFTETVDENGSKTMELAFLPAADGTVRLPSGSVLEPMTLYALFEAEEG